MKKTLLTIALLLTLTACSQYDDGPPPRDKQPCTTAADCFPAQGSCYEWTCPTDVCVAVTAPRGGYCEMSIDGSAGHCGGEARAGECIPDNGMTPNCRPGTDGQPDCHAQP